MTKLGRAGPGREKDGGRNIEQIKGSLKRII